jgi:hypothetical protein
VEGVHLPAGDVVKVEVAATRNEIRREELAPDDEPALLRYLVYQARLRARERALEEALGPDAAAVGPIVPPGTAIDPAPKPGEHDEPMLALRPLPPRRSLGARLFRRVRRGGESGH